MQATPRSQKTTCPTSSIDDMSPRKEISGNEISRTRDGASRHLQEVICLDPQPGETLQQEVSNYLEQQEEPGPAFCQRMSQAASAADCRQTLVQLTTCCTDRIAPDRAINLCIAAVCRMLNITSVHENDLRQARYFATEVLLRFGPDEQNRSRMQTGLTSGLPLKPFAASYINGQIGKM